MLLFEGFFVWKGRIVDRTFIKVQIRIDLRFVFLIYIKYNSGGQRSTLHQTEILNLDLNFNYKEQLPP